MGPVVRTDCDAIPNRNDSDERSDTVVGLASRKLLT